MEGYLAVFPKSPCLAVFTREIVEKIGTRAKRGLNGEVEGRTAVPMKPLH